MAILVDPRGPKLEGQRVQLAPRDGTLSGTVILFDNGKCHPDFGSFFPLFSELKKALGEPNIDLQAFHYESSGGYSHLNPEPEEFAALLKALLDKRPTAVVFAVCDVGVTFPTIALALALENAGVRTVSLCTQIGIQLGNAMAASRDVELPLLTLDPPQIATQAGSRKIAEELRQPILDAITHVNTEASGQAKRQKRLPSQTPEGTIDMDPTELFGALTSDGLGDGIPILAPTPDKVNALLAATTEKPETVLIARLDPAGAPLTMRTLAANAALAGCEPEQFPIVVAAIRAVSQPRYRFSAANITTHGSGNLLIVSGPAARKAAISSGAGCLGPGAANRANIAIGRTLTLVSHNVGRAVIGGGDLGVFGTPAEISYCFAESEDSPWPSLASDLGNPNGSVTVVKAEAPHNVLDQVSQTPENLLRGFVLAVANGASNNSFTAGDLVVILSREHASMLAKAGWDKAGIKDYLFTHARVPRAATAGRGIRPSWPAGFEKLDPVPIVHSAEDIYVVVAGGLGVQSVVALPWGYNRAVSAPVGN